MAPVTHLCIIHLGNFIWLFWSGLFNLAWFSHNILEPTMGVTFFNSGSKSDPTELFPSIVQVIAG
jgi:hypothetical protein